MPCHTRSSFVLAGLASFSLWAAGFARDAKSGLELIAVPGGVFSFQRQKPVEIAAFQIGRTQVTVAAYAKCVDAGVCTEPAIHGACNWKTARAEHPINCVSWDQAFAFCRWMGGRLLSEEEREYAATGGSQARDFPWGNEQPAGRACWNGDGSELGKGARKTTCAAGSHPNGDGRWGAQDLAGNVWEWTSSYDPETGEKIVRGASWLYDRPQGLRSRTRAMFDAGYRSDYIGFRCAKEQSTWR